MNRADRGAVMRTPAVVDVGTVGQDRSGRARGGDLRRVQVGVVRLAQVGPLHRDVGSEPARHHPGRPGLGGHVTQVDEHLQLLVARLVAGHDEGVVPEVDVQELLVAQRALAVLGAQHGLVEPEVGVGEAEQLLGQVDDPIVHDDVVERAVLEGEPRHDAVRIDPEGLVARRIHVVGELLRRRDQAGQHRLGGGDGVGWQQPVDQAPPVLFPLRLLGAGRARPSHALPVMVPDASSSACCSPRCAPAPPSGSPDGSEACHTDAGRSQPDRWTRRRPSAGGRRQSASP